jgi:hypothetical protein
MIYTDQPTIEDVQRKLKAKGYVDLSEVDGNLGDMTKDAIVTFRRRNRLPLTDVIDNELLAALETAPDKFLPLRVTTATAANMEPRVDAMRATVKLKISTWWGKFWAWFIGLPSGLLTLLAMVVDNFDDAANLVTPVRNVIQDMPGWVWGIGFVFVAFVLGLQALRASKLAHEAENAMVTGYQQGTVKNDKDKDEVIYSPPA